MERPAVIILGGLFLLTAMFLWVITPRQFSEELSSGTNSGLSSGQKTRVANYVKTWPKDPAYDAGFNALDPSYEVAAISNSLFDPTDDFWGLPRDTKGSYELVDAYCTACHSLSIVMQQRATPDRWKELLIWMEEKQGMSKISSEDEVLILEYVGNYFSTK